MPARLPSVTLTQLSKEGASSAFKRGEQLLSSMNTKALMKGRGQFTFKVGKVGRLGWKKRDKGDMCLDGRMPFLLLNLVKSEVPKDGRIYQIRIKVDLFG